MPSFICFFLSSLHWLQIGGVMECVIFFLMLEENDESTRSTSSKLTNTLWRQQSSGPNFHYEFYIRQPWIKHQLPVGK